MKKKIIIRTEKAFSLNMNIEKYNDMTMKNCGCKMIYNQVKEQVDYKFPIKINIL